MVVCEAVSITELLHCNDYKISNCPCCSGTAKLRAVHQLLAEGVQIRCTKCHMETPAIFEGHYMSYHGRSRDFTAAETITEVVKIWNTRKAPAPDQSMQG